jgi:hypothetical protein
MHRGMGPVGQRALAAPLPARRELQAHLWGGATLCTGRRVVWA